MLDTEDILNELNDCPEISDGENSVEIFCDSWDAYDLGADHACDNLAWDSAAPTEEIDAVVEVAVKECSICMLELEKSATIIECNHEFCESCLQHWSAKHNTCPLCRVRYKSYLLSNGKTRRVKIYRPPTESEDEEEEIEVRPSRRRPPTRRQRRAVHLCGICNARMNPELAVTCGLCFDSYHTRCLSTRLSDILGCPVCVRCAAAGADTPTH